MQITYLIIAYIQDIGNDNIDLKLYTLPQTSTVRKQIKTWGGDANRHPTKIKGEQTST